MVIRACRRYVCNLRNAVSLLFVCATVQLLKAVDLHQFLPMRLHGLEAVPEWVDSAQAMSFMDEKVLRCEADDLGCFDLMKSFRDRDAEDMQKEPCLDLCFQKGMPFAGLKGNDCYCGKSIDKLGAGVFCNAACSQNRAKNCASEKSTRIFRKRAGCFPANATIDHSRSLVGCIPILKNITGGMTVWTSANMTTTQCILKCESIGRVLAAPIIRYDICICSDLLSMFSTADDLLESSRSCGKSSGRKVSIYKTFVPECAPKRFLNRGEGPFTILTSFWGSGNTWLRHLIEGATGIYTGSIYMDNFLYDGGMIGEKLNYLSGQTIIIKDHIMSKPEKVNRLYTSAILIVRNPYDASLAEFARLLSHNNHTGLLDPQVYESADFRNSMKEMAPKWLSHAKMLFDLIKRVMVVYYEDLRQNSVYEMRRVISFLPTKLVPAGDEFERRLMCMILDSTGIFKRASKGIRKNPFDTEVQKIYEELIKNMNDLLLKNDQPALPPSYFEEWHL